MTIPEVYIRQAIIEILSDVEWIFYRTSDVTRGGERAQFADAVIRRAAELHAAARQAQEALNETDRIMAEGRKDWARLKATHGPRS